MPQISLINKISMNAKSTKIILLWGTIALFSVAVAFSYTHWQTPHKVFIDRKVVVDIGAYPNLKAEQQAALQRLSLELHQHPRANAVRIVAGKSAWREGVMGFVRVSSNGNNLFWYDDRFSSPVIGYVKGRLQGIGVEDLVSEEPIHEAARGGGTFVDVDRYNNHLRALLGIDKPEPIIPPKALHP